MSLSRNDDSDGLGEAPGEGYKGFKVTVRVRCEGFFLGGGRGWITL